MPDLKFQSKKVSNREFSQQVIEIKAGNVDDHDRLDIQMAQKTAHTTHSMFRADHQNIFYSIQRITTTLKCIT